ncbi:MAG: YdcH family protein [Neomegalonema sp.]|nr:YdcH family protein [Neomegalonema sp.]
MSHTPHELHEAFPEHADTITKLKTSNAHFARLADEYHELNRTIHRAETNVEPMDDFHIEDLRKRRLKLLDEISPLLRAASA